MSGRERHSRTRQRAPSPSCGAPLSIEKTEKFSLASKQTALSLPKHRSSRREEKEEGAGLVLGPCFILDDWHI